jgi:hypothetical protein
MTAIAWTLVGLMAASLGVLSAALFTMFGRFDTMDAKSASRFDAMDAKFTSRFDAADGRFDAMDAKFTSRFDAFDAKFTSRCDAAEARFDSVNQRIDNLGAEIRSDLRLFDDRLRHVGG